MNLDATETRTVRKGVTVTMGDLRGVVVKVSRGTALVHWSKFRHARPEYCRDLTVEPPPRGKPAAPHIQARARDLRARIKACKSAKLYASADALRAQLRAVLLGLDNDGLVLEDEASLSANQTDTEDAAM